MIDVIKIWGQNKFGQEFGEEFSQELLRATLMLFGEILDHPNQCIVSDAFEKIVVELLEKQLLLVNKPAVQNTILKFMSKFVAKYPIQDVLNCLRQKFFFAQLETLTLLTSHNLDEELVDFFFKIQFN